ncbi:MAG: hypothetical protein HRU06_12305 [Oceanospirillaceae bacterium]|nr:hypothetical protein [Oceanospirillaceae bacterium]
MIILDSAIEREKEVQDIGVQRKLENFVVTLLVMKIFSGFLGASRICAYFRDSTAEFRIKAHHSICPLIYQRGCGRTSSNNHCHSLIIL